METAKLVLEFTRVMLSLPVVVGALGIASLVLFKSDLRALLRRVAKVRLPGGSEVSLESQAEKNRREERLPEAPQPSTTPTSNQVHNTIVVLEATARMWEFRYLNYFLVPNTQLILDFLAASSDASVQTLDLLYEPAERDAILNALFKHQLIEQKGDVLHVTDRGREYIKFRGPLQPRMPTRTD